MAESLFRTEAIEAKRSRLTGSVIAAAPPSARVYTWLVGGAFLACALLLLLGSYRGGATVRGTVSYAAGIARVHPSSAGEVEKIEVAPGQAVSRGAPLALLRIAQGRGGLTGQIAEIDAQLQEIDRQLRLAQSSGSSEASAMRRQKAALEDTIGSLGRQRELADAQVTLATTAVARAGRLLKEGAGTLRQEEDARAALLARRGDLAGLEERISTAHGTLAEIDQRLAAAGFDEGKSTSQLLARKAELISQRDSLARADHLEIAAPADGQVADVAVQPGQHVTPETALMTIAPHDSRLEIWLYAPSDAIGFVHPGQDVRVRFDAFPYRRYGSAKGVVTQVSRVAVDASTLDAALGLHEPVFQVRVLLDRDSLAGFGHGEIRSGMTVAADLLLDRRPLWRLLVGSLSTTGAP